MNLIFRISIILTHVIFINTTPNAEFKQNILLLNCLYCSGPAAFAFLSMYINNVGVEKKEWYPGLDIGIQNGNLNRAYRKISFETVNPITPGYSYVYEAELDGTWDMKDGIWERDDGAETGTFWAKR